MRWIKLMAVLAAVGGCVAYPYRVNPLVNSIKSQSWTIQDDSLRIAVVDFVYYLDSLRMLNSTEARKELGKLNGLTVAGLVLGSGAAIYASSGATDQSKARIAGGVGVIAAFISAMASQFHHKEDSQAYRTCSHNIELALSSFVVPQTAQAFDAARVSIVSKLDSLDCLAPLDH